MQHTSTYASLQNDTINQLAERATTYRDLAEAGLTEGYIDGFGGLFGLYGYAKTLKKFVLTLDSVCGYDRRQMNMLLRAMARAIAIDCLAAPLHFCRRQDDFPRLAARRAVEIFETFCDRIAMPMDDADLDWDQYKMLFPHHKYLQR